MLDELEDLPSQFIGPESDGLCVFEGIFTGTKRSSGMGDFEVRGAL